MMHDRTHSTCSLCLLIVTLMLPAAACSQSQGPGAPLPRQTANFKPTNQWFTLAPAVDEFSVEMPAFSVSIPAKGRNTTSHYTYLADDESRRYMVLASPLLEGPQNTPDEEVLNLFVAPLSESETERSGLSGPPKTRKLTIKDASGVEHRWANAQTILARRVYLRKKVVYQLEAFAPASETAAVERFLESFTFEKPKLD